MLRITENFDGDNTVRLRLDGTVSESSFDEIDEAFSRHIGNSRANTIVLDMAGVVFMNNDAAKRIKQLPSQHVRIINCSPFIEILLNTVAAAIPE
jgi:anti-anti-sigma regulatory factor